MKRLAIVFTSAFVGFVFAVLALGVVLHVHPVRAGAPTGQGGTGDTNGDGVVDVSDAIFTLLYLFKGGPAPVACADSPELVGRVAALEAEIAELQHGQGCTPDRRFPDRFVDNGDGTATDPCSRLMWARSPLDSNGDGSLDFHDRVPWEVADSAAQSLELGGYSDWRLPSVHELGSLSSCTSCSPTFAWTSHLPIVLPADGPSFWVTDPAAAPGYHLVYSIHELLDRIPVEAVSGSNEFQTLAVRGPGAP